MDHDHAIRHGRLTYLETQGPLQALADVALRVAVVLTKWSRRARTRRALERLNADQLRDIGLSAEEAWREAALPFWRD